MTSSKVRVAFAPPFIGEEEIAEVVATLRSGWLAAGPRVAAFEVAFRALVGSPFVVATSSCTGALHIALHVFDVDGGEVVLPTMTFAATALTAVHAGARPVLADIEEDTLNVDPADVARRMTPRTRAIMAVHYAGLPCAIDELVAMARGAGVPLVEDAAHAIGCYSKGRHAGSIGDAGAFSFYANKNLTTIEGGMLTTARQDLAERARTLRLQGISRDAWRREGGSSWRYDVVEAGFKYPMNDVQAAVGLHQMKRLAGWQDRRAAIARRYRELLAGMEGVRTLADAPEGSRHGNHLFVVRIDRGRAGRDAVATRLREDGVETSVHFVPLHLHPYFQREWGYREGDFPVAERVFAEILSLPMHPSMSDGDVDLVVDALARAVRSPA
jgi:dTDP-4-amino-4,6-dideoxygalactose transaminase